MQLECYFKVEALKKNTRLSSAIAAKFFHSGLQPPKCLNVLAATSRDCTKRCKQCHVHLQSLNFPPSGPEWNGYSGFRAEAFQGPEADIPRKRFPYSTKKLKKKLERVVSDFSRK
ncbi:hypothetical protein NPIL_168501 [Nephila pilipes]|uniref:Uncharacterized protein n=1 Tax=Nephila pilipes TaxID=299642 RepID=A0A8X6TJZ1_NEPPI|nr:hypothetical protein NPIL_168501 [Nephila pilipes]